MLYLILRIVIVVSIVALFLCLLKRRYFALTKTKKIVSLCCAIIIFYISILIPIESSFVKFDSPNEAFNYIFINQKIIKIIESNNCAFIIYGKDGSKVNYTYLDKNDDKWVIRSPYSIIDIKSKIQGTNFVIRVTNNKKHKQLLVLEEGNLQSPDGKKIIIDNQKSIFNYFSCKYAYIDYYTDFYYTIIDTKNLTDYSLTVDGDSIRLN